ncbi:MULTISPECIES: carbohydrate ABC transporter permease [unclassified Curtobacterium]|uniref:carbohydrate ABC transporter permease n=1 Tax=unclassified Curtobacterium TaxID=257496 RepID=UPI000DAAD388|nr:MULTISPECIES: carbohydrate ABC transporter permease [unclassified Curtobacterium]WIB64678.1 carbohydrate ABC transporter permease [Curtobacterium sp. MCBD17_040]WIB68523.1 carbohydrate ABC transporter permease [Curtobacterium sp. MCBD17_035]
MAIDLPTLSAEHGRARTRPLPAPLARRRRRLPFSGWHFLLVPVAFLFLLPFLEMFITSVEPAAEINAFPPAFIPSHVTLDGFRQLFAQSDILHWLLNTVIVSAAAVGSHLVLCSLAGYGFARLSFPGRSFAFLAVLATIMIPTQLLMVPTYVMFARVGLIDHLGAAIVPWLASAFGIFLMRQFFLSLPAELEEAGLIDGCTRLQVFFRIILPLARPALATLAIFTLLGSWNDLVWPLIAINNEHAFTLQLGLTNFQGSRRTEWSLLMAGNVIATLPLILFFLAAQKQFVATMTFAGLKG